MDELKNQLIEKLGLDEGAASSAIEMVLGFVKDKLPDSVQGLLDSAIGGEEGESGGVMDTVKGLFGGD